MHRTALCAAAIVSFFAPRSADGQNAVYFWVVPFDGSHLAAGAESFVIEVTEERAAAIRQHVARYGTTHVFTRIAPGARSYNKNYYAPGQPVWNWHVASVDGIYRPQPVDEDDPKFSAHPTDIAADPAKWIAENGDEYRPLHYRIGPEIEPSSRAGIANVSNRGVTGVGEKALITGLIISGGEPRNVVVRALGPTMTAAGVQEPAANPKIEVYQGSRQIAVNSDWKMDTRSTALSEAYPALAPTNEKEAALLLTLVPGTYTLHGVNEEGTEGVMLLEAYDVDSETE